MNLDQILARRIKGYAFRKYPNEQAQSAVEYREKIKAEIESDYAQMSIEDFKKKYESYIY